ncbi:Protein RER1 [Fasciola hepatica]|uniref:Protein RER1 n=1 Tax=Fasciola hepatica TaxID=6192 RepID=A0A4E0RJP1_FASHE|nr:Protein RER1 [Fasciola hepatica]
MYIWREKLIPVANSTGQSCRKQSEAKFHPLFVSFENLMNLHVVLSVFSFHFVNEADAIRQIALISLSSYFHMGCDFWLYDGILSYSIRCCHPSHRLSTVRAILIAIVCTFFPFLDIPVFWPILVLYFIMLFTLMMKRQIKHMLKYRYMPFTYGKPKHTGSSGKETSAVSPVIVS